MQIEKTLAVMAAAAGLVMGIAPLLQAVRVRRRGRADDVSPAWLGVIVGGTVVWATYGLSVGNWAIIVSNVGGCLAAAVTLVVVVATRRSARESRGSERASRSQPRAPRDEVRIGGDLQRPSPPHVCER
jgi:uncharacterized protein with PQ loop repeat